MIQREIAIMKKCDHPFIVSLYNTYEDDDCVYLVMEYMKNGSLFDYIRDYEVVPEGTARRLFTELLIAIQYIHSKLKVVHRDLKAENIMLDENYNARLIDFGLCNVFDDDENQFSTKCGSPAYTPPEMAKNQPYTKSMDIWSLGVVLYSMLVGELPFQGETIAETIEKIAYEEPDYPNTMSLHAKDLIKKMLIKSPRMRIDLEDIINHQWFSKTQYILLSQAYVPEVILDKEIIHKMTVDYELEVSDLAQDIKSGNFTENVGIYRQLKCKKSTQMIRELIDGKRMCPIAPARRCTADNLPARIPRIRCQTPTAKSLNITCDDNVRSMDKSSPSLESSSKIVNRIGTQVTPVRIMARKKVLVNKMKSPTPGPHHVPLIRNEP